MRWLLVMGVPLGFHPRGSRCPHRRGPAGCGAAQGRLAHKLFHDLFANYSSALRPAEDTERALNVTLQVTLSQIIDMVSAEPPLKHTQAPPAAPDCLGPSKSAPIPLNTSSHPPPNASALPQQPRCPQDPGNQFRAPLETSTGPSNPSKSAQVPPQTTSRPSASTQTSQHQFRPHKTSPVPHKTIHSSEHQSRSASTSAPRPQNQLGCPLNIPNLSNPSQMSLKRPQTLHISSDLPKPAQHPPSQLRPLKTNSHPPKPAQNPEKPPRFHPKLLQTGSDPLRPAQTHNPQHHPLETLWPRWAHPMEPRCRRGCCPPCAPAG